MSYDDEDPEVIADLQLRAYTEKTRKGLSEAGFKAAIVAAAKPDIIGEVPCRGRCGAVVGWTQQAEDAFNVWNGILARKVEAPLDKTRIVFCNSCRDLGRKIAGESNRKHIETLASVIRQVKASGNPDGETKLLERLKELNHPDVFGLLEALRAKRDKSGPGKRTRMGEVRT
jgi:hypothetical protein